MKATIKLPITSGSKILVDVGDKVDPNTILAQAKSSDAETTIFLAQLLHTNPSLIHRHLKKRVGQTVATGDLLAEKRSLFSSSRVRSPNSGQIKEIDLKKGTLTLLSGSIEQEVKVTLPCLGKVVQLGKDYIEVELEGKILKLRKGYGDDVFGKLIYLTAEAVGVFDVDCDVDDSIILAKAINEETVVKLEVLGALGLVTQASISSPNLPWGQVDEEQFEMLTDYKDKKIWLRPKEKEIVIYVS